jgi:hypothetical protein
MVYGSIFRVTMIICLVGAALALFISGRHEHADENQPDTRDAIPRKSSDKGDKGAAMAAEREGKTIAFPVAPEGVEQVELTEPCATKASYKREHSEHARSERTRGAEAPLLHPISGSPTETFRVISTVAGFWET